MKDRNPPSTVRADEDEVLGLYARGLSVFEVACMTGRSTWYVYDVLYQANFPLRPTISPNLEQWGHVDWARVLRDYEGVDLTRDEICKKYGITVRSLYLFLATRPGVKFRRDRGFRAKRTRKSYQPSLFGGASRLLPPKIRPELDAAVQAYIDGVPTACILDTYLIPRSSFYLELKARKIPLRAGRGGHWAEKRKRGEKSKALESSGEDHETRYKG